MANNIDTITVHGLELKDDTDFAMEITVTTGGAAIDWTAYTINSGLSDQAGDAPYLTGFVTGSVAGVLTFRISEANIDTQINTNSRKRGVMIVTADDATTKSRIFEAEFTYSKGKTS